MPLPPEVAGGRKGFEGKYSRLFHEAWRLAQLGNADWVVLENVSNVRSWGPCGHTGVHATLKATPTPSAHLSNPTKSSGHSMQGVWSQILRCCQESGYTVVALECLLWAFVALRWCS